MKIVKVESWYSIVSLKEKSGKAFLGVKEKSSIVIVGGRSKNVTLSVLLLNVM